jgi:LemA protein
MTLYLWVVAGAALIGLYAWYVTIVTRRNRVSEALAGIDVQLTQRHELIPNVLKMAKRFLDQESGLMEEITKLRAAGEQALGERDFAEVGSKFATEDKLGSDLGRLFAVAENYPDLKSEQPLIEAQHSLQEVETNIAAARRFYNSAVSDLRNATQIFPGSMLAGIAGVSTPPPFFTAAADSEAPVDAAAYL